MSIFKKPETGFLAKLFKHKQVEELAEELAHTYADEMQEDLQSESDEPTATEDTAAEPVPMLEVTESGEVDFTEPPETTEGESPPQDTADSTEPKFGDYSYPYDPHGNIRCNCLYLQPRQNRRRQICC